MSEGAIDRWEAWSAVLRDGAEDLRAEVVMAELLLSGALRGPEFFFMPNGGFQRPMDRDIERLLPPGSLEMAMQHAAVELNRRGLYDGLPEGVFHQSKRSKPFKPLEEVVRELHENDRIEKDARRFFWPLDHELIWARVLIELNERRLTTELLDDRTRRGVVRFWDPPDCFSEDELGDLLVLMPVCYRMVSDLRLVSEAMTELLQVPVRLEYGYHSVLVPADPRIGGLSEGQLGVDTVLSGEVRVCERVLEVVLGPSEAQVANTFSEGQIARRKLEHLMDLFIPADQRWLLHLDLSPAVVGAHLATDQSFCRLGVTSILN